VRKMAALADATVTPQSHLDALQDAAHRRGFDLLVLGVSKREEVVPALDTAKANGAQAVNLLASPLFTVEPRAFIERVVALRLPAMHQ
jgi:putative tryptophan/tyrosine transport system substrate-binding protein